MKKTFLNLRKMGFVLLAAGSMVAISCGGETAEDEATDAVVNDAIDSLNEATEEMEAAMDEVIELIEEVADTTAEGTCEEGACEDGACEGGDHSCDHGE